jgi:hypothetical protein
VSALGDAVEAFLNDAEERVERLEVLEVGDCRYRGPLLSPRLRGSPGEVHESDRGSPGDLFDVVVGP